MKRKVLFGIATLIVQFSYSQSLTFIGKINYSKETLLSSGFYKEKSKSTTYFNKSDYAFQNESPNIDLDKMVNKLNSQNEKIDKLDSFELKRNNERMKKMLNEKLGESSVMPIPIISYDKNISNVTLAVQNTKYCVIDTLGKIDWKLSNDTSTIEGLICQKARGWFAGKFYDVWFAPSVNFGAGPLNMHGLPGIIVLAVSEDKKTRYKMTKLEYPLAKPITLNSCNGEKQITKLEYMTLVGAKQEEFRSQFKDLKKGN